LTISPHLFQRGVIVAAPFSVIRRFASLPEARQTDSQSAETIEDTIGDVGQHVSVRVGRSSPTHRLFRKHFVPLASGGFGRLLRRCQQRSSLIARG